MWSDWLVFCYSGFYSVCPLMEKDKRLREASWWERLIERETGPRSDGWAIFSKSLIQFSFDEWSCVPSLLLTWGQTMMEVMKIIMTSFKRSHSLAAALSAPRLQLTTADPILCLRLLDTHGQVWVSLLWDHCSFSRVLVCTSFYLCSTRVCFLSPM